MDGAGGGDAPSTHKIYFHITTKEIRFAALDSVLVMVQVAGSRGEGRGVVASFSALIINTSKRPQRILDAL